MCIIFPRRGRLQKAAASQAAALKIVYLSQSQNDCFIYPVRLNHLHNFSLTVEPGDQWEVRILAPTKDKTRQDVIGERTVE